MLDWKKGPNEDEATIPVTRYEGKKRRQVLNNRDADTRGCSQRAIDSALFRNPLAEKMVEDAIERSKYNTKSLQLSLRSARNRDDFDEKDEFLDRRIAMAATKKRRQQQTKLRQDQPRNESMSYSRRQHRQYQQQSNMQRSSKSSFSKSSHKSKIPRSQTPIPMPRPSILNKILPKRRNESASTKGSKGNKRETPPTTYCPPLSTPLVPIREGKAMKDRKKKFSIKWKPKITPFQPD